MFALLIFTITLGCKKDDEIIPKDPQQQKDPKNPEEPARENAPVIDISIVVPDGANIDLANTKLYSYFQEFDVKANGSSQAILNSEGRSLALLLGNDKNIILMGFLSENVKEISVRSTLQASFYLGLGTVHLPHAVREEYFENFGTLSGLDDLINEASSMFVMDNGFFGSGDFQEIMRQKVDALRGAKKNIDITSRINADGSDIRSGIQLREDDIFSFSLINTYRRRSHGFVYKKTITDENDGINDLYTNIVSENPAPFKDVKINSPQAIREVLGVVSDYGSGTGLNFARTEAGPITLKIDEGEKKVLYKCRVIGPALGAIPRDQLNSKENEKLDELIYETFAYELVLPIFLDIAGHTKLLDGLDERESKFAGFVSQLQIIAASVPAVDEALKEGDYQVALSEFLKSYYNNLLGANAADLIKALLEGVTAAGMQNNPEYFIQNSPKAAEISDGMDKYLKRADLLLKISDYSRILYAHGSSEYLEEWDVPVTFSKVTLLPVEGLAIQSERKSFKVEIQDSDLLPGQAYEYRYSTTGEYGILLDAAISSKEGTQITSSQNEVIYFSSSTVDLPDDAEDKIFVEVYIKQGNTYTKVNSEAAEAKVKIKPLGFEISPKNIIVSGNTSLTLNLRQTDGQNPLENATEDYRIIWETSGKFGLFNGSQSNTTKLNDTKVIYEALETEGKGSETVVASIYARSKGTADPFQFLHKVETTVKIDNNADEIVFYVPVSLRETVWGSESQGVSIDEGYFFKPIAPPPNREIVRYRIVGIEFIRHGEKLFHGTSQVYYPGNEDKDLDKDGNYSVIINGISGIRKESHEAFRSISRVGYARVTVFLKPKE